LGRSVAFDRDGHLWTLGSGAPHILRLASLGASGSQDISIALPNVTCELALAHLAFDPEGNLWLTKICPDQVLRIAASELETSGDKEPDASLTSVSAPDALAFDRHGNLWVTSAPRKLLRFDAARLGGTDSDPADLELSIMTPGSTTPLKPTGFAFDASGNLWGLDYEFGLVYRLTPADLTGTGVRTVEPPLTIAVGLAAPSTLPAFDESGGLWFGVPGSAPMDAVMGRLSPEQLALNSGGFIEPEVLMRSPSLRWARVAPVAFFPAPAGLPLFHSLPAP
jgi:streptogramin lyase